MKIDKKDVMRLEVKTKILDYIGEGVLNDDELESLVYDIFDITGVRY